MRRTRPNDLPRSPWRGPDLVQTPSLFGGRDGPREQGGPLVGVGLRKSQDAKVVDGESFERLKERPDAVDICSGSIVVGHVLRVAPLRRPTRPIDIPWRLNRSDSVAAEASRLESMPELNKSLTT